MVYQTGLYVSLDILLHPELTPTCFFSKADCALHEKLQEPLLPSTNMNYDGKIVSKLLPSPMIAFCHGCVTWLSVSSTIKRKYIALLIRQKQHMWRTNIYLLMWKGMSGSGVNKNIIMVGKTIHFYELVQKRSYVLINTYVIYYNKNE